MVNPYSLTAEKVCAVLASVSGCNSLEL